MSHTEGVFRIPGLGVEITWRKITYAYLVIISAFFLVVYSMDTPAVWGEYDDYTLPVASILTDGNFEISERDIDVYKEMFPIFASSVDKRTLTGYFTNKGEEIVWYYPIYPILSIPFVWLLQFFDLPAEYAFVLTNLSAFILALLMIFHCLKASERKKLLLMVMLSIHPIIFLFPKATAETVMYSLLIVGMVSWCNKWYKRSAIAIAVAGMLNPTILSVGIIMIAEYMIRLFQSKDRNTDIIRFLKINILKILEYGVCFIPGLIPFIYNYLYTGQFNFQVSYGLASGSESSLLRFLSYLFDLNYGIFPYFSLLLSLAIILMFAAVIKKHWQYISLMLMFFANIYAYSFTIHINCGMMGIARYNAWCSVVLIFAVCMYFDEIILKSVGQNAICVALVVGIVLTGSILHGFGLYGENISDGLSPIAKYVLDKAPVLYNPLHSTFNSRVNRVAGGYKYETPIVYVAEDGYVRKILATKDDAEFLLNNYLTETTEHTNEWFKKVEALTEKERYISLPLDYRVKRYLKYELGSPLLFGYDNYNAWGYVISGLSVPEKWGGTWTDGNEVIMEFSTNANSEYLHGIIECAVVYNGSQRVVIYVNDDPVYNAVVVNKTIHFSFKNPGVHRPVIIRFELPDATSPADSGSSGDTRTLSLALKSIEFVEQK